MTSQSRTAIIQRWFKEHAQCDGPLLPDGWHGGRAGESTLFLADVSDAGSRLQLVFNEDTTLSFEGPTRVRIDRQDLVFYHYHRATLAWRPYGSPLDTPITERSYDHGEIRLAAPLTLTRH